MPRKPKHPPIQCEFFLWKLMVREGVYYADGRSGNQFNLGKHSLGTRDQKEARENLKRLDRNLAVQHELTTDVIAPMETDLSIQEGWQRFFAHCERSQVLGGVCNNTLKRYRAVRDKHLVFCLDKKFATWSQINKKTAEMYGAWLVKREYSPRTLYLELNLLVSVNKWLVEEELLPASARFRIKLIKSQGSDTYCYTREQVTKMVEHCGTNRDLRWMKEIIVGLATTGMRIGEFVSLRWSDIDLPANTIHLTDERSSTRKKSRARRTIKGKRGRAIPLHTTLKSILLSVPKHHDGVIFHGPRGGILKPDVIRRNLIKNVIAPLKNLFTTPDGEVGFKDGRLHSFRHYFISESFRQDVSEAQIMEWVGHKDSDMVKLYRHLRAEDSRRHMERLDFGTGLSDLKENLDSYQESPSAA